MLEKKKALRPKAASGKAVAVPLFLGKLLAAEGPSESQSREMDDAAHTRLDGCRIGSRSS
jgi:hypothetical protein